MSNRVTLPEPLRLGLIKMLRGPQALTILLELANRLTLSARANYEHEGFDAAHSAAGLRVHNEALTVVVKQMHRIRGEPKIGYAEDVFIDVLCDLPDGPLVDLVHILERSLLEVGERT